MAEHLKIQCKWIYRDIEVFDNRTQKDFVLYKQYMHVHEHTLAVLEG